MTHIGHSEKMFIMKRLLLILVLTFSFQSWTKADDISDFEIEGVTVGQSLLDYISLEEKESIKLKKKSLSIHFLILLRIKTEKLFWKLINCYSINFKTLSKYLNI